MKSFFIITNLQKDSDREITMQIQQYLEERGRTCNVVCQEDVNSSGRYAFTDARKIPEDTDVILVIGGDGTFIQAARDVVEKDVPLLGINLGTLGYLAEINRDGINQALDRLLEGTYEIEERMMLEGTIFQNNKKQVSAIALNDIVLARSGSLRIMNYRIAVNGRFLSSYEADGIVIATPTGSTGYSMSAGGPIISPNASMIVITPICPHTLGSRSIVLGAGDEIELSVVPRRRSLGEEASVSFDGDRAVNLTEQDRIVIKVSDKRTRLIKISKDSFLQTLSKKMKMS